MSVVLLDPRFPTMVPVDTVSMLSDKVSYTEEVPVRIRWHVADLGGDMVDQADVLVTTNLDNPEVVQRLEDGEQLYKAPSLLVETTGDREIEESDGMLAGSDQDASGTTTVVDGDVIDVSDIDNEVYATAVQSLHQYNRDSVSASTLQAIEDALKVVQRAYEQGAWERSQTHHSLLPYLREEVAELEVVLDNFTEGEQPLEEELSLELSDLLLQVLFHTEIARRREAFDIGDVAAAFVAKMYRRAPYLFEQEARIVSQGEQNELWDAGKKLDHEERLTRLEGYSKELIDFSGKKAVAAQEAAAQNTNAANTSSTEVHIPSALDVAEHVINKAKALGLSHADIPQDILYPRIELTDDQAVVGNANQQLMESVTAFNAVLEKMSAEKKKPVEPEIPVKKKKRFGLF